ncbi:MAG: hypothetical protein B7Z08_04180 [Sphingomonadales bacterium 32-68-7]|nr:MAG: hypothetical protein B7Z33_13635 [Sphingomonadales bacterium 12-68-11]OYX09727.1 MAG: hypothetical protein B7Z08_04180 [Sphingomonadales bacterium 32-68-7]
MYGIEERLLVAYGLILLLVLAAAGLILRHRYNSRPNQERRAQARMAARLRLRAVSPGAADAEERAKSPR